MFHVKQAAFRFDRDAAAGGLDRCVSRETSHNNVPRWAATGGDGRDGRWRAVASGGGLRWTEVD